MTERRSSAWIELDDADAKSIDSKVELSLLGEPLDYDTCLAIGVWRRLNAGERTVPCSASDVLQRLFADHPRPHQRVLLREKVVREQEVSQLLTGMAIVRLSSVMGFGPNAARDWLADEVLVAAGVELALLMGCRRFAGSKLLTFMALA